MNVHNTKNLKKHSALWNMFFNFKAFRSSKLFFTDEFGQITSAQHFKRLFIIVFFSFIILLPCTVISFYLFTNSTQKIILLKKKINYTEKKIIFLREKFDILNAKKIFEEKEGSVLEIEKIIDTKIKKYKSNIEKFVIFKDKEEGFFQVEFNVQNKTNKNENLIGRLFIILDPKFEGIKPIVFPSYVLDRKKIDATKGHYFSFVNSAIFRFKIKSSETLEKFKKCIILLYSMDGKLIKEKKILIRKSLEANL